MQIFFLHINSISTKACPRVMLKIHVRMQDYITTNSPIRHIAQ